MAQKDEKIRMRRSVWTLAKGAVVIEWPETILPNEAEELSQFIDLTIKTIRRQAETNK